VSPSKEPNSHQSGPPTDNPRRHRQKVEHPQMHTNKIKTTRSKA
jgi:hypothetical protein